MLDSLTIRNAKLVGAGVGAAGLVDIEIAAGRIVALRPATPPAPGRFVASEPSVAFLEEPSGAVLDAGGAFALPGLWDQHVHLDVECLRLGAIDLREAATITSALTSVAAALPTEPGAWIVGFGHRLSRWDRTPTVAELDAVTGDVPAILVSGDCHNGWLNEAALTELGAASPGPLYDNDWFPVFDRLRTYPFWQEMQRSGLARIADHCLSRGIVGLRDVSFTADPHGWVGSSFPLRVRLGTYPEGLEERITLGLRTGDPLPASRPDGRHTQGPSKSSRTAHSVPSPPTAARSTRQNSAGGTGC